MSQQVLSDCEEEIRWMVVGRGFSMRNVTRYLQRRFPGVRGLRSDDELDEIVRSRVSNIGYSYGRRSLQGLLRAEGIHVSQRRLGRSLQRTFPLVHSRRTQTHGRLLNPIPYRAEFFWEKIHFDQNEKLVMYGIVHVIAVDGFSRKIVGFSTMPHKNLITIFGTIYRPLLLCRGIWNQLRSDHGTEFALVSAVQQYLASHRLDQRPLPVLQTTSRENHRVERL